MKPGKLLKFSQKKKQLIKPNLHVILAEIIPQKNNNLCK
jgi:hypothetical protein